MQRQSVFDRLAGCEDVDDADRWGHDPAMRWSLAAVERDAASTVELMMIVTRVAPAAMFWTADWVLFDSRAEPAPTSSMIANETSTTS